MEIEQKVINIVADHLGYDEEGGITAQSKLSDFGADSLDVIEIVMKIEKELDIRIDDSDVDEDKLRTVQDLIDITNEVLNK